MPGRRKTQGRGGDSAEVRATVLASVAEKVSQRMSPEWLLKAEPGGWRRQREARAAPRL